MGLLLVDDFSGKYSNVITHGDLFYRVDYRDWKWDFNREGKDKQMYITFVKGGFYSDNYIDLFLKRDYCINCEDVYGKVYNYDYLVFSWKEQVINLRNDIIVQDNAIRNVFQGKFNLSIELMYNDESLGEFLVYNNVKAYNKNNYKFFFIDLSIFDYKKTKKLYKFNKVRIRVLRNLGEFSKIYFGDLYLLQDSVEHNLLVSIEKEIHNKYYEKVGKVLESGENYIILDEVYDLEDGFCIAIAKNERDLISFSNIIKGYNYIENIDKINTIVEFHQVKEIIPVDKGYKLTFYDNFDGEEVLFDWGIGTEVFFVVPVVKDDFIDETYKMPLILLTYNYPSIDTFSTERHYKIFNILFNRETGQAKYGVIKDLSCLKMEITISIFCPNLDVSNKIANLIRNKLDILGYISIFDLDFDIEEITYRTVSLTEYAPSAEFVLSVYCFEKFDKIDYEKYYELKEVITNIDIIS
jgi:hypothetical protein